MATGRGRNERGYDFGRSRANGRASRLLAAGADVENKWLDWESQIRSQNGHGRGRIERALTSAKNPRSVNLGCRVQKGSI